MERRASSPVHGNVWVSTESFEFVMDGRDARRSITNYFCVGAGFCGAAGVAGCDFVCPAFTSENTDVGPVFRAAKIESVIDVTMKIIADQVVARERTDAAPRGPKAV